MGTALRAKARVQANKALRTSLVSQLDAAASGFGERVAPPTAAVGNVKKEKKLKACVSYLCCIPYVLTS